MIATEPSLADLATASGVEARTIRSWVAQGLIAAPLTRGPMARYPAETLERVLAIRAMRDVLGMSLTEIRKELLIAEPEKIRAYSKRAPRLVDAPALTPAPMGFPEASSALSYISALRAKGSAASPPLPPAVARPAALQGFEALEQHLSRGRADPARKTRAEEWLHLSITPDVALTVRAPLDPEQRVRLERCADLIRDILLGRDR